MENISFIISLLTAITLIIFMIVLLLDVKKSYNLKLVYARLICISVLILLSIADLISHIIMKESIIFKVVIVIAWVANLLITILYVKSCKKVISSKEKITELQNKLDNSINCE